MKRLDGSRYPRSFVIICLAVLALASLTVLSSARANSTSVNVVNNSSREVRHMYLSHVDADDWSNDLLSNSAIGAGQSRTVGLACDGQQMKVVAEDQDGCFSSTVVTCGDSATWTITNDTARDCGSGGGD